MRVLLFLLCLLIFMPLAWAGEPRSNLTVLTDTDLMPALSLLAHEYGKNSHTPLTLVARDEALTEAQIEQGIEAQILISTDRTLIERLTEQGLTNVSSRRTIAHSNFALVGSPEQRKRHKIAERISFAAMLKATGNTLIYSYPPDSREGKKVWAITNDPRFKALLNTRLTSRPTLSDLADAILDGGALAIIPASDIALEPELVILSPLPEELVSPATIDAVVLGGESMDEATAFVSYLQTPRAQELLTHFGYQPDAAR